MRSAPEPLKFRPRRRPSLELGMTPLIDIVFLLLIFFMLTSHFVVQEGIQVDLPVTEKPHTLQAEKGQRILVRSDDMLVLEGKAMTPEEMNRFFQGMDAAYFEKHFEILADRSASIQAVVSVLETLREQGASRVTLGTVRSPASPSP